ncbi:hypothetical protein HCN44_006790 [Aphidius gifuensis]|uniref:MYND-type domain-containing protein n=1 Tax=Aphidius gifuensis TaxID=684658 RepID=A0A834XY44_APHGI|nr:hypothetical protein HCN44_006790 [Aphidius gifuensis]
MEEPINSPVPLKSELTDDNSPPELPIILGVLLKSELTDNNSPTEPPISKTPEVVKNSRESLTSTCSLLEPSVSSEPAAAPESSSPELNKDEIKQQDFTKQLPPQKKYSEKITSIKDPNWKKRFGQIMGDAIRTTSSINHHELRIKNIVDYLSNFGVETLKDLFKPPPDCKDAKLSSEYRAKGDYYYTMAIRKSNDKKNLNYLEDAHKNYTMSIAYAPINSIELSLGQASRSAVLFHAKLYADCCDDIDRSIDNGCPDELRAKLLLRKAMCYQILTPDDKINIKKQFDQVYNWIYKMDDNIAVNFRKIVDKQIDIDPADKSKFPIWNYANNIPKLNKISNSKINGLIDDVKLKFTDDFGRHIVAGKDIKPGEIIGVIEPYAKVHFPSMRYKFCCHCGVQTWSSIPCNSCPTIIFCSTECHDAAQAEYHNLECPVFQSMRTIGLKNELFLVARTVAKAIKDAGDINDYQKHLDDAKINTDPLDKSFTNETFNSKKFSNIYNFLGHPLDSQLKITIYAYPILLAYFYVTMTDNFCKRYSVNLTNLKHDPKFLSLIILTQNIMQLINKNSITMMTYCDGDKRAIIHGLYPAINFFNQSSTPSMVSSLQSDKLVLTVIQPIKKGRRIFFNCEQHNSMAIKSEQKNDFLDKYYLAKESMIDNDSSTLSTLEKSTVNGNISAKMIDKLADIKNKLENIIWLVEHFEQTDGNVPDISDIIKDANELIKKTTSRGKNGNEFLIDIFNTLERFYQSYNSPCVKLSG